MSKNIRNQNDNFNSQLPFHIINEAVSGDADAINTVLKHYEGYIFALSTRQLYDKYGNSYRVLDDDIRRRLETKLITAILKFDVAA